LTEYKRLRKVAENSNVSGLPQVEGAWARIDGAVHFLIAFPDRRLRLVRDPSAVREGGAPTYELQSYMDRREQELAAVAAIRFEQSNQPSRNNLYNEWLAVCEDFKPSDVKDGEPFLLAKKRRQREKMCELIRFAKTLPFSDVPTVERVDPTRFRVSSVDWGYVRVDRSAPKLDLVDSFEYTCAYNRNIEQSPDPERARALACAAALLLDFPQLARK